MLKPEEILTSDPETLGGEGVFAGPGPHRRVLAATLAGPSSPVRSGWLGWGIGQGPPDTSVLLATKA
jgi:hypothetical protein